MPILTIQQRIREVGRIRIGDKGPKGEPRKLTTFRFTSFDKRAIEAAAVLYGGAVRACTDKDLEGQFEVITNVSEITLMASNIDASQYMELWSGGGCQRRCDGQTELLSGKPCMCEAGAEECKPTTRLPVILPDLPGLGVWRLESKGWHAAVELIQSFELLRSLNGRREMAEGLLAVEERRSKKDGKTRKFMVPVIRIASTPRELLALSQQQNAALPGAVPALPTPVRDGEHVLGDPNPRGATFAILRDIGLPPHDGEDKTMYYGVFGKFLGRTLTSLAAGQVTGVTDDEWGRIAQWLHQVKDGSKAMPRSFQEYLEEHAHDPMSVVEAADEEPAEALL